MKPDPVQLNEIARLIDAGKVKPLVDKVLSPVESCQAHEFGENGQERGKIVLKVD